MVGDNIKKLRKSLGLTQQAFAERLGINQGTLSAGESGKSNFSRQTLLSISREFGVRLEWLETGEGEMYSSKNLAIMEQLSAEFDLDDKSREFLENFLRLTPENRRMVVAGLEQAAKIFPRREGEQIAMRRKPDSELTKNEVLELIGVEYDEVKAAQKRDTSTSLVSIGTSGTSKKISINS